MTQGLGTHLLRAVKIVPKALLRFGRGLVDNLGFLEYQMKNLDFVMFTVGRRFYILKMGTGLGCSSV